MNDNAILSLLVRHMQARRFYPYFATETLDWFILLRWFWALLQQNPLPGAWLSSRSTLVAACWSFAGRAFNVDDALCWDSGATASTEWLGSRPGRDVRAFKCWTLFV